VGVERTEGECERKGDAPQQGVWCENITNKRLIIIILDVLFF
jgi:hypothetical protein